MKFTQLQIALQAVRKGCEEPNIPFVKYDNRVKCCAVGSIAKGFGAKPYFTDDFYTDFVTIPNKNVMRVYDYVKVSLELKENEITLIFSANDSYDNIRIRRKRVESVLWKLYREQKNKHDRKK